jgi:hypothetical protein
MTTITPYISVTCLKCVNNGKILVIFTGFTRSTNAFNQPLYSAVTWTLAPDIPWRTRSTLHKIIALYLESWVNRVYLITLKPVRIGLLKQELYSAGHCSRSKESISKLLLWGQTELIEFLYSKGAFNANYSRQLLNQVKKVSLVPMTLV